MTMGAISESVLGAFRESPLGARETYATTAYTLRANGELRHVSVDTLETGELIGIVPDANPFQHGVPYPQSIGGDDSVVWYVSAVRLEDNAYRSPRLYGLDPNTAAVLSESMPFPDVGIGRNGAGWNVGGGGDIIWAVAEVTTGTQGERVAHLLSLSPDTFEIQSHHIGERFLWSTPAIGGDADAVWHTRRSVERTNVWAQRLWELSTETLEPIRSRKLPGWEHVESELLWNLKALGVGGGRDHVWLLTEWDYRNSPRWEWYIHELDPVDLSVRQSRVIMRYETGDWPDDRPIDIGGN